MAERQHIQCEPPMTEQDLDHAQIDAEISFTTAGKESQQEGDAITIFRLIAEVRRARAEIKRMQALLPETPG